MTPNSASARQGTTHPSPKITNVFALEKGLLLTAVPPAPNELNDNGVKWWNYYCTIFVQGKVLSRLFITSITNLCLLHQLRDLIIEEINEQGGIMLVEAYLTPEKEVASRKKLNPLVKDLNRVVIDMDKLLASMGCTAYTARVNNFDTKGNLTKASSGPPTVQLFKKEA
jgi:hypothetical protein